MMINMKKVNYAAIDIGTTTDKMRKRRKCARTYE